MTQVEQTSNHSIEDIEGLDEDIEGLDEDIFQSQGWDRNYSLDLPFVSLRHNSVSDLVRRIDEKRFILDPDFQRDFIWSEIKQSRLIESCLMRIPLPVFYVSERKDESVSIVDGLQRLTTLMDYIYNRFDLYFGPPDTHMTEQQKQLTGKKFRDLPKNLRERIEDTPLTIYVIGKDAPKRAKLDIFDRVNSGVPINKQQMRNAMYCGPATEWLKSVVETNLFKSVTGKSLSVKKMRDREAVNRFVSFKLLGWQEYPGYMDDFLADGLEKLEKLENVNRLELTKNFEKTLEFCFDVFGIHTFRKSMFKSSGEQSKINMSLFDVISVQFSEHIDALIKIKKNKVLHEIKELSKNESFMDSIAGSTSSKKSVIYRHSTIEDVIKKLIN